jgi:hypothetical protein
MTKSYTTARVAFCSLVPSSRALFRTKQTRNGASSSGLFILVACTAVAEWH